MAPQAPQLPELPKVSGLLEPLARTEREVEARIREATKMAPPPGPLSTLQNLARSLEAARVTEALPKLPRVEEMVPGLPEAGKLPGSQGSSYALRE
jgi:hypothetical protein